MNDLHQGDQREKNVQTLMITGSGQLQKHFAKTILSTIEILKNRFSLFRTERH